jgi:hypothetical protein
MAALCRKVLSNWADLLLYFCKTNIKKNRNKKKGASSKIDNFCFRKICNNQLLLKALFPW